jgi:hypothetical protein
VNPLVSVALGFAVLGERCGRRSGSRSPSRRRASSGGRRGSAGCRGSPTALAVSFALYGLVRKLVPISSLAGFALEMLFLARSRRVPRGAAVRIARAAGRERARRRLARGVGLVHRGTARVLRERDAPAAARPRSASSSTSRRAWRSCSRCCWFGEPFTRDHAIAFGFVAVALVDLHLGRAARDARAFPGPAHSVRESMRLRIRLDRCSR